MKGEVRRLGAGVSTPRESGRFVALERGVSEGGLVVVSGRVGRSYVWCTASLRDDRKTALGAAFRTWQFLEAGLREVRIEVDADTAQLGQML
jgi:hypothetical protein